MTRAPSTPSRQRETYEQVVAQRESRFLLDRPPYFSPAVAAEDATANGFFGQFAQTLLPLEYTNWAEGTQAHVRTCYLGDWSPLNKVEVSGPQALEFLSWLGIRDLSRFAVGQIKHHVQLDPNGWVASEGVLCRLDDDLFRYTAGSADWLRWQLATGDWDAEVRDVSPDVFIFGVQGPASLRVLDAAATADLRDIAFSRSRPAEIAGVPVRLLRTGISGELGYEIHGPAEAANEIWSAVLAAGTEFGIRQLGFRSQSVQHIEAGIATNGLDYLPSSILTPGAPTQFRARPPRGSFVPTAVTDYFRTPGELGWAPRVVPDHDFLGREALVAAVSAGSPRVLRGLTWNDQDVLGVTASLTGPSEPAEQMELPRFNGVSFDQVLVDGSPVGISSGRASSLTLRATISLCVIDRGHAEPGTEVVVAWGSPGTPQREIRATVTALPFKPDRRRTDVTRP